MTGIALIGKYPSWSSLLRKCVVSLIKDAVNFVDHRFEVVVNELRDAFGGVTVA